METQNVFDKVMQRGISYNQYLNEFEFEINNSDPNKFNEHDLNLFNFKKLNFQRTSRIHKTFKPSEKIISAMKSIDNPQFWMVITENWCGDSAQSLPYIYEISKLNSNIEMKIILRDKNLDIMDNYLTDGKSRSIPKMVVFNEFGEELFQWGPRPTELVNQIDIWKSEGLSKDDYIEMIHLWYAKNKGKNLEAELIALVEV